MFSGAGWFVLFDFVIEANKRLLYTSQRCDVTKMKDKQIRVWSQWWAPEIKEVTHTTKRKLPELKFNTLAKRMYKSTRGWICKTTSPPPPPMLSVVIWEKCGKTKTVPQVGLFHSAGEQLVLTEHFEICFLLGGREVKLRKQKHKNLHALPSCWHSHINTAGPRSSVSYQTLKLIFVC